MKKAKRLLAGAIALASVFSVAACGDKKDSSKDMVDMDTDQKATADDAFENAKTQYPDLVNVELKNKTIKWMAHYDINPSEGKVMPPDIYLFQEKYGGKIEYVRTSWDNRYTDLANAVMSGDGPDFFPADDMDTFPKGAIMAMFQPIDDYVPLDSELWKDSKKSSDAFVFNGKHYVAVIETSPNYVCVYNKNTIEEANFDDPAELFAEGKWNLDVFAEMCTEFTDASQDKYGLDGYWYQDSLMQTCGLPFVSLKDGKLVSNMEDPAVEKIENYMYDLQKSQVVFPRYKDPSWATRDNGTTGAGIGSGLTLFVPVGLWALEDVPDKTAPFGDVSAGDVMFVPMPDNADNEPYYISARVNGYNICSNAPNPEGVAVFLNCKQIANQSEEVNKITTDQLMNEYGWTEEMVEMRTKVYDMAAENPVFEFYQGISGEVQSQMDEIRQATMMSDPEKQQTWAVTREEKKKGLQYLLDEANNNIKTEPTK